MTGRALVTVTDVASRSGGPGTVNVQRAAWLSDEILLMACQPGGSARGEPVLGAPTATIEGRRLARDGPADDGHAHTAVYAAGIDAGMLEALSGVLRLQADDDTLLCDGSAVREALTDLRSLAREELALWSPAARDQLLAALSSLGADRGLSRSLSESLFAMREALRERQPLAVHHVGAERAVQVEQFHRVDRHRFYMRGWLAESAAPLARLEAVSPEGERIDLLKGTLRHPRPDVAQRLGLTDEGWEGEMAGFVCYFMTSAPSRRSDGWLVELVNAAGRGVEAPATFISTDPDAAQKSVVAEVELEVADRDTLLEAHVVPALTRLQALRRERIEIAASEAHGTNPARPELSIVVPLDRRIELLEHQLAQFADDPQLHGCELIYVLHCSDHSEQLRDLARGLFRLYGLPFRVITLTADGGSALATNMGARVASGARLLLLSPSVIPAARGWLGMLSGFFAATPGIGALAPKLLYEDGAIDQAGTDFVQAESGPEWASRARFRGLERSLPAANVARVLPAVGHHCMLVDAAAFSERDGLCCQYLTSEYRSADLCLRLGESGLDSWYLPQVELYRLDGDARSPAGEGAGALYDRWLLSRRHSRSIGERRKADPPGWPSGAPVGPP